jgi:PEP-CTERM motif
MHSLTKLCALSLLLMALTAPVHAGTIYWTDWTSSNATGGFTAFGAITTPTATVNITYNNPQGVAFYQANGGTDYWQNGPGNGGRNAATSPYTSATVDNIPTGTDIVALQFAGMQTLTFSQAIANPVFSYVSLNGNGYAFDRDFTILSYGDSSNGNDPGFWGAGTSSKQIVDIGGGVLEYRLIGTGEPHGTIQFLGAFDSVSWRSMSSENWNGFTVGVQETAAATFAPEPTPLALLGIGLLGLGLRRRK